MSEMRDPMEEEAAVIGALRTVTDPEIGIDIVELGLFRRFEPGPPARVSVVMTTPFCPYAPQMVEAIADAASQALGRDVEVKVLAEAWVPPPDLVSWITGGW
jgi:metal-sulfur cluster biosynthetic enzyme